MNADKFDLIRKTLETAAFSVAQPGAAKEAHAAIVRSLVLLSELEASPNSQEAQPEATAQEIGRVVRRLKKWAQRADQINTKILTAYLRLEKHGAPITVSGLRNELPDEPTFDSNFSQMRIIAAKAHGKIFETYGDKVELWPPVVPAIREFERAVFGDA